MFLYNYLRHIITTFDYIKAFVLKKKFIAPSMFSKKKYIY